MQGASPFSKLDELFFGYFDPENVFQVVKINNFRRDLTNTSVKKEALVPRSIDNTAHILWAHSSEKYRWLCLGIYAVEYI